AALPREHHRGRLVRDPAKHHRQASARPPRGEVKMAERPTLRLIPNEEQAMLADTARKLVEGRAKVARLRELRKPEHPVGFSRELYGEMVELGFTALSIPEEHDGMGLGLFDLAQVLESLGRELAPEPLLTAALLGAWPLARAGSDE